jgi:fatty acid synthase subunit alpha, fungi type
VEGISSNSPDGDNTDKPVSEAVPTASAVSVATKPQHSTRKLKELEDVPLKASHVLRAIVAQKLKKEFVSINDQKSVKELVGGKSTLQNEIVGDLTVEFGQIPDRPEDLSLEELGSLLENGFSGKLGKYIHNQLARMFSAKMPPGYTTSSAKQFMAEEWRFGPGRQELCLLLSLSSEPAKRLSDPGAVRGYWEDILSTYCTVSNIKIDDLKSLGGEGLDPTSGGAGVTMTPAMLKEITKKERALFHKQFEALAGYLGSDIHGANKLQMASRELQAELREKLDLWESEMGSVFESGISPLFSPFKVRQYDSEWNWARQDALTMYYDIVFGRLRLVDREIVGRCIQLMNRANPDLLNLMEYYIKQCPSGPGENYPLAKELAKQLYENCSSALEHAPVYKDVSYPTAPKTTIDDAGIISYAEVLRSSARKFEDYVSELAASKNLGSENGNMNAAGPKYSSGGVLSVTPRRHMPSSKRVTRDARKVRTKKSDVGFSLPFVHLKRKKSQAWEYSSKLSTIFLNCLETAAKVSKCALARWLPMLMQSSPALPF